MRVEPEGVFSKNRSNTSTYLKIIHYIHFPSYNTSSANLSLKVPHRLYSEHGEHTVNMEIRP